VKTDPKKTAAISAMPNPRSAGETRRFLGMAGYYRRFNEKYVLLLWPRILIP